MHTCARSHRSLKSFTLAAGACAALIAGFVAGPAAEPAAAEPSTITTFTANGSATMFSGLAFDACTAPTLATMTAWMASPFTAVGIYLGGVNRTCAQPELTASWVTAVTGLGWRLLPIYKGLQPPCGGKPADQKISPANARAQGEAAANDAIAQAISLGLFPGSAFYNDIENYTSSDTACRTAVLTYLSHWTKRLHYKGYVAGVYLNLSSGAQDVNLVYTSSAYARPDAIWIARYDGVASLSNWSGISNYRWAVHQRAKQYLANQSETWGGATVNIDRDLLDAPVGTVPYPHTVTSTTPLNGRSTPSISGTVVSTHAPGSTVRIVCQTSGSTVGSTTVWNRITNGAYVSDYYVDTTSNTTYSPPIARCTYPFQATNSDVLTTRSGPGTTYPSQGTIPAGGLVYVTCQGAGTKVANTSVWDKLIDGRWVTDAYVSSPSFTTYSPPIPRC